MTMPMYYPDLKSVRAEAIRQTEQPDPAKRYTGIVPETEDQLLQARRELGQYFRTVWKDVVQALEIEEAVDQNDYHDKLGAAILKGKTFPL